MKVQVIDSQKDLLIDPKSVAAVVEHLLHLEDHPTDELIVHLVAEPQICELHERFFADPSPTDCISFPIDQQKGGAILGELFICPKAAVNFLQNKKQINNENLYREVTLYLVHALLHLLGYDDLEPKKKRQMRRAEMRLMKELSKKNLLLRS